MNRPLAKGVWHRNSSTAKLCLSHHLPRPLPDLLSLFHPKKGWAKIRDQELVPDPAKAAQQVADQEMDVVLLKIRSLALGVEI